MNANQKNKWLEALRSGKYKKGRGRLLKQDRYCCLGVYAEEVIKAPLLESGDFEINNGKFWAMLPSQVMNLSVQRRLALVNDTSGGFDKVIEIIENTDLGEFNDSIND